MKGIINYYVKIEKPADGTSIEEVMQKNLSFVVAFNKTIIEESRKEGYAMMFIPTYNESSHYEKIDFNEEKND